MFSTTQLRSRLVLGLECASARSASSLSATVVPATGRGLTVASLRRTSSSGLAPRNCWGYTKQPVVAHAVAGARRRGRRAVGLDEHLVSTDFAEVAARDRGERVIDRDVPLQRDRGATTEKRLGGAAARWGSVPAVPISVIQARPSTSPNTRDGITSSPAAEGSKGSAPTASAPVPGSPRGSSASTAASVASTSSGATRAVTPVATNRVWWWSQAKSEGSSACSVAITARALISRATVCRWSAGAAVDARFRKEEDGSAGGTCRRGGVVEVGVCELALERVVRGEVRRRLRRYR